MQEILQHLNSASRVLDLGSSGGSFDPRACAALTVAVDIEPAHRPGPAFVRSDAAALPFPCGTMDAVICNHSMEHFVRLGRVLEEIKRVLRPGGALYVSVPDATTFTDKLYRWLARGGGHVNTFTSSRMVAAEIESSTGLRHVGTRLLFSSLSFLNRHNRTHRAPRKLWLLANGSEPVLFLLAWLLRQADQLLHTRLSVYGWALYFGQIHEPLDQTAAVNVCIRCGSGHKADWLRRAAAIRRRWAFVDVYRCPACGAPNPLFRDADFAWMETR